MIHSIKVTNHLGEDITLELTRPGNTGFIVSSVNGLGPPKATINTTKTAAADGTIYNSSFLDARNITMSLIFEETKTESIEVIRQKSYKYFPIKRNVELEIQTDKRLVKTKGYVESNEPSIFTSMAGCNISIVCPDPFLYAYDSINVVFSGVTSNFEFPFENDAKKDPITGEYIKDPITDEYVMDPLLELGIIENKTENVVYYEGDSEIGFQIIIHALGDVTNLRIYNVDTKDVIVINTDKLTAMTGSAILNGDTIFINTKKGYKSATLLREGHEYNIINCLGRKIDWFTLMKGDNTFAFTADTGSENLQFSIIHELVYDGV